MFFISFIFYSTIVPIKNTRPKDLYICILTQFEWNANTEPSVEFIYTAEILYA